MSTFIAVNDELLSQRIEAAARRVVLVAPAISNAVATALGGCFPRADKVSITIVLDTDEDPYRLGYGDPEGLETLQKLARDNHIALRAQRGLRIGLLLVDDDVLVWSPTPKAVEGQRDTAQPNGLNLTGATTAIGGSTAFHKDGSGGSPDGETRAPADSLADFIRCAVGADDSEVPLDQAEIGRVAFAADEITATLEVLKQNPPAAFDLARKTRVLSTKLQFVEFEQRGAAWTKREIKLSSLLLNPDIPEDLQDLFETRVRPFSSQANVAIEVPALVQGQVAHNRHGEVILSPMTQADMERSWNDLLKRYLRRLKGFGWLIRRTEKEGFEADTAAYEGVLKAWVAGFQEVASNGDKAIAKRIVDLIKARAERSAAQPKLKGIDLEATVLAGIQKLRATEPSVKLVFKEISWESTRDREFTEGLRRALPAEELKGWFEVFTAARQRCA